MGYIVFFYFICIQVMAVKLRSEERKEKRIQERKQEILRVAATLYQTMKLSEITMNDISKQLSFSRASIYNYFPTKESIFLAFLTDEVTAWDRELRHVEESTAILSRHDFCCALADSLQHRLTMLRLLAFDWGGLKTDGEETDLIRFYSHWDMAWDSLRQCMKRFLPTMSRKKQDEFMTCLTAYMHGLYPLSIVSEREKNAMKAAHISYHPLSLFDAAYMGIDKFLPK